MRMLRINPNLRLWLAGLAFLAVGILPSVYAEDAPEKTVPSEVGAGEISKESPAVELLPLPSAKEVKKDSKSSLNKDAKKTGGGKVTTLETKEALGLAPEMDAPETPEVDPDHKIAPTETIRIDVYGEKDMTAPELRVQAGGKVKYYLIGDVDVGGKTAIEAADHIRQRLIDEEIFVDPQVIVTIIQYRKQYVYVQGDVIRPGAVPLEGEMKMSILDAIGQAQGLTRAANRKKIKFIHRGKVQILDVDKLNKNSDPKNQIILEPGDTIIVPQTLF
jgi:protein involved in polysaccharide export with SLBB domain